MRTLFAVNQWLCNIFSLAPPTISRPPLAQYFPFSCDASAGRLPPSTTPLSARFSTDFAVNPSAESITHFEWLRTSALAASVSGAFLSPISLPRRLRNVFACMGAIEAGSATGAEDGYGVGLCTRLRSSSVVARERWYELRVPYTFPPRYRTRAHSAAAGTALNLVSAVPAAHPFRRAGRCAGSTSLPAPACRPTPALEQGGGRTRAPRQPSSLRPPARLPARLAAREPLISKMRARGFSMRMVGGIPAGREGWRRSWAYGIYPHRCARPRFRKRGRERRVETAGGTRGHEDLACRRDRGYPAGREGWCRVWAYGIYPPRCARAPDFENAGGNGGWKRRAGRVRAKI
ncbi:hypothetical protein B0H14DRAFT_2614190 [Mycena olivaceomarginata]|nr:hypothetical protein B0H14DRAFT_2614190 [Mycena olivaceomarginata]